ncbi:UdgX family uracil-DNA binding protein [soil metagenome]
MRHIELESQTDIDGFRRAARELLSENVAPHEVDWHVAGTGSADLFEGGSQGETAASEPVSSANERPGLFDEGIGPEADANADSGASQPRPSVPRSFVTLCESVILHSDPARFGLLYGLLWRLTHEPSFRHDTLDPAMTRARLMSQAVRRDMHKMTAFVRFRELPADAADESFEESATAGSLHVAWFEPEHHIVDAIAPFFVRRFTTMKWAILTPERSVRWDGRELHSGPGGSRDDAPGPDGNEALWLTYYAHIFNPARLKVNMMQKEMPRKYWRNLPEAKLIAPLVARAEVRSEMMVSQGASTTSRRVASRPVATADDREPTVATASSDHGSQASGKSGSHAHSASESLEQLAQAASRCRECPIGENATQVVWGEGRPHARLMVVGEQPGDQEDLQGRPFVGPSGKLFDRAVAELGWSRKTVYVTNAVKHFKFEVRGRRRIHKTPSQREAAACLHWLESEIEAVQPEALIALGGTAARSLMGRAVGVMSERGHWLTREDGRKVLITLHPSALLRLQDSEREAAYEQWLDDLRKAASIALDAE